MNTDRSLRLTEIFCSLQGEARSVGLPTIFVRLTGCPLRCNYCDSAYAFHGGERWSFQDILERVESFGVKRICVTGGEPLAQPLCLDLLEFLADKGYELSLETSGAMDVSGVDARVSIVMDLKTPSSTELEKNLYSNLSKLTLKDQLKFVLADRQDYDWARFKLDEYNLTEQVGEVLFSPSYQVLAPADLAAWILEDRLDVRMQMQLHKIIWGDKPGV